MSGLVVNSAVIIAVVGMATPATLALSISTLTGNPLLRPLGITQEMLAAVATRQDEPVVQVELHLPEGHESEAKAMALGERIKKTFQAKGADAWVVVLRDPATSSPFILYRVKQYQFGPYSVARSAHGVIPALAAYREIYGAPGELKEPAPPAH